MNINIPGRSVLQRVQGLVPSLTKILTSISAVWSVEHNDDGTHAAITGTSLAVTDGLSAGGDGTVGGDLDVDGALAVGDGATFPGTFTSSPHVQVGDDVLAGLGYEPADGGADVAGMSLWGGGANPVAKVGPDEILPCRITEHDLGNTTWLWRAFYGRDVNVTNVYIGTARIRSGTGDPEGAVTGNVGDLFLRTDGGSGTTLYVKESGTGDTGWDSK